MSYNSAATSAAAASASVASTSTTAAVTSTVTTAAATISTSTSSSSTSGGNTLVFTSIASEDGYVGKLATDGFSTSVCKVGGKGGYTLDDYRIILSFDTKSLPSTFSSAVLTINRQSLTGSVKPLVIDLKAGTFGSTTTLTQMSYYGVPSAYGVGKIDVPTAEGSTSSFQIPSTYFKYITSSSTRTQIMLRQDMTTSLPSASASILQIFDGQATLTITLCQYGE